MLKKILISLIFLLIAVPCFAAEYHVATTGSDSTGDGSSGSPWRHPEYGAKQLSPGDTLIIHEGDYVLAQSNLPSGQQSMDRGTAYVSPPRGVDGTADSPFIIKGAEGEDAFLDAGTSPEYPAVGSCYGNYVYVDNVRVRGAAIFMWMDYGKLTNSELYGGIDCPASNGGDNFGNVLRIEGGTGFIARNNLFRDNQVGHSALNSPLLMEYDSSDFLIENNEFRGSVGYGIRVKDNAQNGVIRYNFIHNNDGAGAGGSNQDSSMNVDIYQNMFLSNNLSNSGDSGGIRLVVQIDGVYIYNNTFVDNNNADIISLYTSATGINAWNNIMYRSDGYYIAPIYDSTFATNWDYSDYNNFYGGASWREQSTIWNTLADYQSGNGQGFDANSHTNDPDFVNPSGLRAEDYKRNSYPTDGRGGSYESVMGAYVTGNEVIGISSTTADEISVTPTSWDAGDTTTGNTASQTFTVENIFGSGITITDVSGLSSPFSITSDSCTSQTLSDGETCGVDVQFAPTSAGTATGYLQITTDSDYSKNTYVEGTGVDPVGPYFTWSPTEYDYGTHNNEINESNTFTLTANDGAINGTNATLSGSSIFSFLADACSGTNLAENGTCNVTIDANSTTIGSYSGTLTASGTDVSDVDAGLSAVVKDPLPGDSINIGNNTNCDYTGLLDTYINVNTDNYSSGAGLNTYTWPANETANVILVQLTDEIVDLFDHRQIESASLHMYRYTGDTGYDVTSHNIEGVVPVITEATGYEYATGYDWDFSSHRSDGVPLALSNLSSVVDTETISGSGWYTWDVTDYVTSVASGEANRGLGLKLETPSDSDANNYFRSSEYTTDETRRPYITVIFTDITSIQPMIDIIREDHKVTIHVDGPHTITIQ